jgi:crotonobetainyl-CoA:carnitine CoA-transferase CaiB-like acyl-CoA transferase
MTDLPLRHLRVLDLTHVWAGPLGVRFLSDLGAEVVKIEAPFGRGPKEVADTPLGGWLGGEPGDEPWNMNAIFVKLHRNRKSLCLDLGQPTARELFLELVTVADVVIENFSARAMPEMGLGYEILKKANPRIIYVGMPGYGMTGPYRDRVAFGPTVEAMSGFSSMLGYNSDEPCNSAIAVMDPVAGTHAAAAVMEALLQREQTGLGELVELSLHEGGVTYSGPWLLEEQLGNSPKCIGNRHPEMAPHGIYRCKGIDKWVSIACKNDQQWAQLCQIFGDELSIEMTLADRLKWHDEIDQTLEAWTEQQTNFEVTETLQHHGIASGPVNTTPDITADEQVKARGFYVPYEKFDTPMPGNAIQMDGIDRTRWTPCPGLGANNREVLQTWLTFDDSDIDLLTQNKIIFDSPPS